MQPGVALKAAHEWYRKAPRDFPVNAFGCTHDLDDETFMTRWKNSDYDIQFAAKRADIITRAFVTDTTFLDDEDPINGEPLDCDGFANVAYCALYAPQSHRAIYQRCYDRLVQSTRRRNNLSCPVM